MIFLSCYILVPNPMEPHPDTLAFHVYILTSVRNPSRYYIGFSSDPLRRLLEHNNGKNPSTTRYAPWRLSVTISFSQKDEAMTLERYLKSGSGRSFVRKHLLFQTSPRPYSREATSGTPNF